MKNNIGKEYEVLGTEDEFNKKVDIGEYVIIGDEEDDEYYFDDEIE